MRREPGLGTTAEKSARSSIGATLPMEERGLGKVSEFLRSSRDDGDEVFETEKRQTVFNGYVEFSRKLASSNVRTVH